MSNDLKQHEHELEAEFAATRHLFGAPSLGPAAEERIRDAVRQAVGQQQATLRWRRWASVGAAAAAVLLAVGVRTSAPMAGPVDDQVFDAWMNAATESSSTFTMLYERPLTDDPLRLLDELDEEQSLEVIDQSLQAFENLFGA